LNKEIAALLGFSAPLSDSAPVALFPVYPTSVRLWPYLPTSYRKANVTSSEYPVWKTQQIRGTMSFTNNDEK